MAFPLQVSVQSLADTAKFAQKLSELLQPGDLVILHGGLGAGKTHIVKALASALNTQDEVSSPTYTIANFYRTDKGNLLHIDAYRLESATEFWDLGLEEYFETAIVCMEWGQKYAEDFEEYLTIDIELDKANPTNRIFSLQSTGRRWEKLLSELEPLLISAL